MAIDRAPWTALVDDDGSNLTGSIWNKAAIKTVLLDPIDANPTWIAYTPVWSGGDGTGPVIGNGVLEGRYVQQGKWVDFSVVLFLGSTSTVGNSSYWRVTLPFVPRLTPGVVHPQHLNFHTGILAANGTTYSGFTAWLLTAGSKELYATNPAGAAWSPTLPFTWAANALFTVRGTYEVP